MQQTLRFKRCAQDCRELAKRERHLRLKSMLLALAEQLEGLANAREAFLKRYPARVDAQLSARRTTQHAI